jgi:peptidoglycan/xylan/chitin deacetylase (PgdA/CDA1 family)
VAEHGVPALAERGATATVFPVAEGFGQVPAWWPEARRTMTAAELEEALGAGLSLGCHGLTHRSLAGLPAPEHERELAGARKALEQRFATSVEAVAYPYGHHDADVRSAAAAAGFRAGLTFLNGRAATGMDPFRLPRLTMGRHHGRVRFALHLARGPADWADTQLERVAP